MSFKCCVWVSTYLAAIFGCNRFRIIPDIVSKLLLSAIWRLCNVLLESEQTTFLRQITFHFQSMGLQTLVAIDSESPWHCFQAFACRNLKSLCCSIRIWADTLSILRQVVDLDLLLCTGFDLEPVVLFQCDIFTQRPGNDGKIERSNGRCFGWQQFSPIPQKISFHMRGIQEVEW